MAIVRSGSVIRLGIVMVLQHLTAQLFLVAISCLSAWPMHMVEYLNLLFTDVPGLVPVAVVAPIGNSNHSSLSAVISMALAVPNMSVGRKIFLKHLVNWNTVCSVIQDLPWRNIWSADHPFEVLNEHLSLLVGHYVPTNVIRVLNKNKSWFDDQCKRAFGIKQESSSVDPWSLSG